MSDPSAKITPHRIDVAVIGAVRRGLRCSRALKDPVGHQKGRPRS
jgi:hypothetical protein